MNYEEKWDKLKKEIKQYQGFAQEDLKHEDNVKGRYHLDGAMWAFDAVIRMMKKYESEK